MVGAILLHTERLLWKVRPGKAVLVFPDSEFRREPIHSTKQRSWATALAMQVARGFRLVMDCRDLEPVRLAGVAWPVDALAHPQTQQCTADWRQHGNFSRVGIGVLGIHQRQRVMLVVGFVHAVGRR